MDSPIERVLNEWSWGNEVIVLRVFGNIVLKVRASQSDL